MLHPVASELADCPIVHAYGEMDGQLSLAVAEDHAHALVQSKAVGGGVELSERGLQRVRGGFSLSLDDHALPRFPL